MKYTLLELTQAVLSSMDSDEINDINDTVESQQVVTIIKSVYDDIISRGDLTSNKTPFNLTASGDSTKPVLMTRPETIDRIEWIKYNAIRDGDTDPLWTEQKYLPLEDFLQMVQEFPPSETEVESMTLTVNDFTFTFHYHNDRAPSYYTTLEDYRVVFDAYDSAVDSTLQSTKTLCYGALRTDFAASNTFEFNLLPQQHALLLNEAKSLAWAELKQTAHIKAEQAAKRNWTHLSRTRHSVPSPRFDNKAHSFAKAPNFGRK